MVLFRILAGIDCIVSLVILYFFAIGLADGTVSSFNMQLWLTILGGVAAVLIGGIALHASGRRALANCVLLLLAGPGVAFGLFFLSLLVLQPRWN